jgi:uncharacterized protein (DUF58 family)
VTRRGGPRLVGFAVLAALGLLGALALRRPELAVAAAPFALVLVLGTRLARDPGVAGELLLPSERTLEDTEVAADLRVEASRPVDRLELYLELPPEIELVEGTAARAIRLRAEEERELPVALRCATWGSFQLGTVRARARDPFRLVTWEARLGSRQRLKAYPREITLRRILAPVATQPFVGSEVSRTKGDGIEYADLRDFVPGDRVRTINWRASARRRNLVVNERHAEQNTDVVLFVDSFVDVRAAGRSVLEDAVRAAAALATRYLARRNRVGLVGFGGILRWLRPGLGATQRYHLIETLLETGVEPTYTWRHVNVIPARVLTPNSLVLALTPLVDPRFVTALEDLRGRRFDVAAVEIDPVPLVEPGRTEIERGAYRLWLLEREVLRSRLQAQGIGLATWTEGELENVLEEVRTYRRYSRLARV